MNDDEQRPEYSTDPGEYRLEFPIDSRVRYDTMFGHPEDGRTGRVVAFRMNHYGRDKYRVRWDEGGEKDEIPSKCLSLI